eukprot:TRINITY_DN4675_c0_g2_i1.p1 TRINITY_DN4675_c0_g2~~TRINITY_DN4675_c0_g2_i1.p1  ORF type:complete len:644 (-),score=165.62 TRINITY_DN4675_c0_g2_i1:780-2711(-)
MASVISPFFQDDLDHTGRVASPPPISVSEALLTLLLEDQDEVSDGFGDQLEDEQLAYLVQLTDLSMAELGKQPHSLAAEGVQIREKMEEVAYKNYKSFIQTSECISDIHRELNSVGDHLDDLLDELPELTRVSETFCEKTQTLAHRRAIDASTLAKHTQLIEILEVPQLMETCVRNQFYDEALEIEAFAQKLEKLHPDIRVVTDIVSDVRQSTNVLLAQLLQRLRSNIQLPMCLRIIGFLRRLGRYSELELRINFLRSRDAWLQTVIAGIPTANAYTYLSKLIDYSRAHLFDIITQYRAIFADETSQQDMDLASSVADGGVLYGWAVRKVSSFLDVLDSTLPCVSEGAAIGNILDQCMYYGMSLGRVGVDFRGLLPPLFEKHIFSLFASLLADTKQAYTDLLKTYKFTALPKSMSAFPTAPQETYSPPVSLLDHPPLSLATNGVLGALNELRQCAPMTLRFRAAEHLRDVLVQLTRTTTAMRDDRSMEEEASYAKMCKEMAEVFLPFSARCFDHVFHQPTSADPLVDVVPITALLDDLYEKDRTTAVDSSDSFADVDIQTLLGLGKGDKSKNATNGASGEKKSDVATSADTTVPPPPVEPTAKAHPKASEAKAKPKANPKAKASKARAKPEATAAGKATKPAE